MDGGGVSVDLGDRDDRVVVRGVPRSGGKGAPGSIVVAGGAGKDYLENASTSVVRFEGGAGDDTLVSGVGRERGAHRRHGRGRHRVQALCCATSYEDRTTAASGSRSTASPTTARRTSSTTCRRAP